MSSVLESRPRKKMRKGTHSCLECRRRKTRCTFQRGSQTCAECSARGARCQDQALEDPDRPIVDRRQNLRERVKLLEQRLQFMLSQEAVSDSAERGAAEALSNLRSEAPQASGNSTESLSAWTSYPESAPLHSLFNNPVLSQKDDETMRYPSPPSSTSTTEASTIGSILSKNARVCRALLAEIPSPADVQAMLEITGVWWATWRGMFPGVSDDPKPLPQYVSWGLSQDCPARVALAVTCIAVSVSKLKPGVDDLSLNLRGPPNELVDRYLAVVDQLVLHDDDYLATLDGVELLALQAKCHNNLGQPRKGWLLFRKAISYAQLLGLHTDRPTILGRMQISVDRRRNVWSSLCSVDRYLSLLLGLPYAVSENLCLSRQTAKPDSMSTELYREKLSVIAGRVIDRNQASTSPSFSATLEIDQKLDDLAGSMADDWWDLGSAKVPEMVSIEEFNHRLGAQFWHHQIKAALHLPFMLRSAADRRFEYSRTACFDASREVLQRYHVLRMDDNAVYFMCRVIDFQGFLAAVGLLLGLLGYGRSSSADHSVYRDQDLNLIRTTLDTFRRVSLEPNGTVATQCLHVLETLSATRDHGLEPETRYRLVVPYFGTITITPGSMYSHPSDVASVPNLNSPAHLFSSTVSMYSRSRQHENVPVGSSFIDAKALGSRPRNGVLSRSTSSMANINIEWQGSTDMDIGQEWNHLDDVHV